MIASTYNEDLDRKKKFYLVLPLLALPFLAFIYWVLVAKNLKGQGSSSNSTGLQLSLPAAEITDEQKMDKFAYYHKAEKDSAAWAQQIKKDPYRQNQAGLVIDTTGSALMGLSAKRKTPARNPYPGNKRAGSKTSPEIQVQQRLAALDKALTEAPNPRFKEAEPPKQSSQHDGIAELEKMMATLQGEALAEAQDPEMAKLDGMLDKLLSLQNADQNGKGIPDQQTRQTALAVSLTNPGLKATLLEGVRPDSSGKELTVQDQSAGFYGIESISGPAESRGITAAIAQTKELISGNTVQLRLTSSISIAGYQLGENTLIHGICSLSGERLKIKINSLRLDDQILPVNLAVYDLDGMEGIYIPGALSRSVAKQSLGSQVQGYDLDVNGFSVGEQAASVGIQMGKMLLGRKTRLTQVTVTQGYKVLLKDINQANQ